MKYRILYYSDAAGLNKCATAPSDNFEATKKKAKKLAEFMGRSLEVQYKSDLTDVWSTLRYCPNAADTNNLKPIE